MTTSVTPEIPLTPPPPAPTRIASWQQLDELCAAPITARFLLDGRLIELPLRRLSPAEQHRLDTVYNFTSARSSEVRPPLVAGASDKYNHEDADYVLKLEHLRRLARAMTIYAACPVLQAAGPVLTQREEIAVFVNSKLTDQLLDLLFVTISVGGLDLADRVSFTSPLDSTTN